MNTENKQTKARLPLKVGSRIRLIRDVERFSDFIVKAGSYGVCTHANERGLIKARMDEKIEGAKEWDNAIQWEGDILSDFDADAEVLPYVRLVRIRCACDSSYLKEIGGDVNGIAVGDKFTLLKNEALIFCETAQMESEYRHYASFWGNNSIYYIEPCGDDTTQHDIRVNGIRVVNHKRTGCSFFVLQDTLWGMPTEIGATIDQGNAMPVKEWDEPLDEAGYQEVCAALGIAVPAITFTAHLQFADCSLNTLYGRGNESKEQNAYDLITAVTQLPTSKIVTVAHRQALVAATIHALGHLLFAQPDATHRQTIGGATTLKIVQSRG